MVQKVVEMNIVIIGFGNIGRSVAKVISEKDLGLEIVGIADRDGCIVKENTPLDVMDIVETVEKTKKLSSHPLTKTDMTTNDLIDSVDADLFVEMTPTNIENGEPGLSFMRRILNRKKHLVTSNKGPLVIAYRELTDLAKENKVLFRCGATIGGAIPILSLIRSGLSGNKITKIKGILNGTTNYILTKMFEGKSFDYTLKEAQELGIAETNPTYDIEGIDIGAKLVVLANELGLNTGFNNVKIEGIKNITKEDIENAKKEDKVIKLIGEISKNSAEVSPQLISKNDSLAVDGTLNAIKIECDLAKEITLIGHGAGEETASAIIGDILEIKKVIENENKSNNF